MFTYLATLDLCNNPLVAAQWGVVIAASLAAAVEDARTHRIPNKLTMPLVASGLVWGGAVGGIGGFVEAFVASLLLALPFVILFLGGAGGAGDAKLMAGVGAWLGMFNGIITLVAVVVTGAILGLLLALSKGRFREVVNRVWSMTAPILILASSNKGAVFAPKLMKQDMVATSLPMPYGVAIFSGVMVAALGVLLWRQFP